MGELNRSGSGCGLQVLAEKTERQLPKPLMRRIMGQALWPDQVVVLAGTGKRQWS